MGIWRHTQTLILDQLDIYRAPCHSRCQGLVLLETFTTSPDEELMDSLPPFLKLVSLA